MKPEEIIQRQLDFYNAHDLEAFTSLFSDNITVYNLADNSVILRGMEAFTARYRARFEVQKAHAKVINRMVIGNRVIDHEHVTLSGEEGIFRVVIIYEVEEDKVARVWFVPEQRDSFFHERLTNGRASKSNVTI